MDTAHRQQRTVFGSPVRVNPDLAGGDSPLVGSWDEAHGQGVRVDPPADSQGAYRFQTTFSDETGFFGATE